MGVMEEIRKNDRLIRVENIYNIFEVAYMLGIPRREIFQIREMLNDKKFDEIFVEFKVLEPYKNYFNAYKRYDSKGDPYGVFGIKASLFDRIRATGIFPYENIGDTEARIGDLNYWQYETPDEIYFNVKGGWDIQKYFNEMSIFEIAQEDIWKIFLCGIARMAHYHNRDTCRTTDEVIKKAICEFMVSRPEYFNPLDFAESEIIKQKIKLLNKECKND